MRENSIFKPHPFSGPKEPNQNNIQVVNNDEELVVLDKIENDYKAIEGKSGNIVFNLYAEIEKAKMAAKSNVATL